MANLSDGTEIAVCSHVRSGVRKPKLVLRTQDYFKINCGYRNHTLSDYDVVSEEILDPLGVLEMLSTIEVGQQRELVASGSWTTGPIDYQTRWSDDLSDELILELRAIAAKILANGGMWLLVSEDGYGASSRGDCNVVPCWLREPNRKDVLCDNRFNITPEFFCIDALLQQDLPSIGESNHNISVRDLHGDFYAEFHPIDLSRFLMWERDGVDPAASCSEPQK